jgi:hypothetical protein
MGAQPLSQPPPLQAPAPAPAPARALPARAAPSSPPPSPASTLRDLQRRCLAVRARVEALDAEDARTAHGGALAHGWDALDKAKGGAEDVGALAGALSKALAAAASGRGQRAAAAAPAAAAAEAEADCNEGSGGSSEAWRLLTASETAALVARAQGILPGRTPEAIAAQVEHLLRCRARAKEKLAAVAQWKALRGSLEAAARSAAEKGGSGGGGGGEGGAWAGPDALRRIAVVEWRAEAAMRLAKAEAAVEAEAREKEAELAAARAARVATAKERLRQWAEARAGAEDTSDAAPVGAPTAAATPCRTAVYCERVACGRLFELLGAGPALLSEAANGDAPDRE